MATYWLDLTFQSPDLLNTALIDGHRHTLHYTLRTTKSLLGFRRITTITAAGGQEYLIDWGKRNFTIGGVQRRIPDLKENVGFFSGRRKWNWNDNKPFHIKWHDSKSQLQARGLGWKAIPQFGQDQTHARVIFTPYKHEYFSRNVEATIRVPKTQDASERAFLIMALVYTETLRQDAKRRKKKVWYMGGHMVYSVGHFLITGGA
ncbi:hypothetical protein FB45DRAFT_876521 [Roridomyces roridus]|uniref:Uncharacterized protein n=1 Tax=Roridomyces roridus TaxID=1738132 RepID=A0AAD7B3X9_9AGAR|nr:hypothetical protein FB45DRAFT_876521 [Roridomyces roridus]